MGEVEVQLHTFLISAPEEVSGWLHAQAALLLWKEPLVPIGQEAGWDPEPVWDTEVRR
jgi:hypothetical protein